MQVNLLPGIKSVHLHLYNIGFIKSPQDFPLTSVIFGGPLSVIIGIPKIINKKHIKVSRKTTCCSATFKGIPAGTKIKLQKPEDLCKRS